MPESSMYPIVMLVLFFSFLFIIFILLKKNTNILHNKKGNVEEIERFYFTPRTYIVIVKIVNQLQVLGVTDNNVSFISTLDDKETIDKIILDSSKNKSRLNFGSLLGKNSNIDDLKNKLMKMRQNKNEED